MFFLLKTVDFLLIIAAILIIWAFYRIYRHNRDFVGRRFVCLEANFPEDGIYAVKLQREDGRIFIEQITQKLVEDVAYKAIFEEAMMLRFIKADLDD